MSFDVFFAPLEEDEKSLARTQTLLEYLQPYLFSPVQDGFARIETPDGGADFYGFGEGEPPGFLMSNPSGERIWDVMVDLGRLGQFAIVVGGSYACVTDEDLLEKVPEIFRSDAAVTPTGSSLIDVVQKSC